MLTKFEFKATGGELFKSLVGGLLLTGVTMGLYYPWFLVRFQKLLLELTDLEVGEQRLRLTHTATGGALFKELIIVYLLSMVTLGIYLPWGLMRLQRFQQEHTIAEGEGVTYRLRTQLTGGELFKAGLVAYLLTMITFGIYAPWMMVKMLGLFLGRTQLEENGQPIGTFAFRSTGGELFKTFIVGYLLTMITLGIYGFWFQVKMTQFFARGTELTIAERRFRADYQGQGLELLKIGLLGYWLTMMTLGIYGFWFLAKLLRYQAAHFSFAPVEAEPMPLAQPQHQPELRATPTPVPQAKVPTALVRAQPVLPLVDPVVPVPSARVISSQPTPRPTKPRPLSVPRALPAPKTVAPIAAGQDRRAAWAKAFLPAEATLAMAQSDDSQATIPASMSLDRMAEVWTDSAEPLAPRSLN